MLMLSNSSMALEYVAHGSHVHGDHTVTMTADAHDMDMSEPDFAKSATSEGFGFPSAGFADEDCLCDDICGVSSVGFGTTTGNSISVPVGGSAPCLADLYQSVSLDLLLPPPNA